MPGMRLTSEQAQRLCGLPPEPCQAALNSLVEMKFLCQRANGQYARSTEGGLRRPTGRVSLHLTMVDAHIARTNHCHVLIVGTAEGIEQWFAGLVPHLKRPICWWSPATRLPSPSGIKTLVIRNVETLTPRQQRELLSWLEQAAVARTRLVSTTTVPLFQRVAAGLFLDTLYYHLNTVTLSGDDLGRSGESAA